jgi:hypothetical protein
MIVGRSACTSASEDYRIITSAELGWPLPPMVTDAALQPIPSWPIGSASTRCNLGAEERMYSSGLGSSAAPSALESRAESAG